MQSKKRFLITGATGMIGTNLIKTLHKSRIFDWSSLELHTIGRTEFPDQLKTKFSVENHSTFNLLDTDKLIELGAFDFIVHAASSAQPSSFMNSQKETFYLNSNVTDTLLKMLKPGGHFIFLSSTEVYTGLDSPLYKENMIGNSTPYHPRAGYIEGKRSGEMLTNLARISGLKATSVRLSYTYGPGFKLDDKRVINELIRKGLEFGKIQLIDSGRAVRTNLYVEDACEMILEILYNPINPTYNVASKKVSSVYEIAKYIGELLDCPVILGADSLNPLHAQVNSVPSIELFEKDYGARNFWSIKSGLIETINWYKELLQVQ